MEDWAGARQQGGVAASVFVGRAVAGRVDERPLDFDRKVDGAETKVVSYESKDGKVVTELWEVVDGGHVTPPRSAARERIIKWMLARSK